MKIQRKHLTIGQLIQATADPFMGSIYKVAKHRPKWGFSPYDTYDLELVAVPEGKEPNHFKYLSHRTANHLSRYFILASETQPQP